MPACGMDVSHRTCHAKHHLWYECEPVARPSRGYRSYTATWAFSFWSSESELFLTEGPDLIPGTHELSSEGQVFRVTTKCYRCQLTNNAQRVTGGASGLEKGGGCYPSNFYRYTILISCDTVVHQVGSYASIFLYPCGHTKIATSSQCPLMRA